jgi:hypothetical protein
MSELVGVGRLHVDGPALLGPWGGVRHAPVLVPVHLGGTGVQGLLSGGIC